MPQSKGPHPEIAEGYIALDDLPHFDPGRKRLQRHRKHHRIHLAPEDLLQGHALLGGPVDAEPVAARAERLEEGKALDVIPVGVRQQDVRREGAAGAGHQLVPQRTEAASGVEDGEPAIAVGDADAGRVAAVARCLGTGRGNGPAGAPEGQAVRHTGRPAEEGSMVQALLLHAPRAASPVTARVVTAFTSGAPPA